MMMTMIARPISGAAPSAAALPRPNNAVLRHMARFAGLIDRPLDVLPGSREPILEHCLVLPDASLAVAGTACRRPLLFREAEQIVARTGLDLVLLRYDVDCGVTYDLRLRHGGWLCRYVPSEVGADVWLLPAAGEGGLVRLTRSGLEVHRERPAARGLEGRRTAAAAMLSAAIRREV